MKTKATATQVYPLALAAWLVLTTLFRAWYAAVIELSPDEAYYWTWSLSLAAGYYDHGPAVAWLIRAGTAIFGDCELGVRAGALVCSVVTTTMVYLITYDLVAKRKHAFWAAILASLCPLFSVGAVVHTPDAVLVAAWSIASWAGMRALRTDGITYWLGTGAAAGVAVLAKMTGLLFPFGFGIFLLSSKMGRTFLSRSGPVWALLAGAVLAAPNLLWNVAQSGGSFLFQFHHVTGGMAFAPHRALEFLGGQAGVVSPILWFGLILFMASAWRREIRYGRWDAFYLWCLSGPLFLLVLLIASVHKVEANWPAVAYLTALPGAAWAWRGGLWYPHRLRAWAITAGAVASIFAVLIHLQVIVPFLPLDRAKDPTDRLRGWRELSRVAVAQADALGATLASEGYGPVSELKFYTQRPVRYEKTARRLSQFDFWDALPVEGTILFLQPKTTHEIPKMCQAADDRWQLLENSDEHAPLRRADFRWWVCTRNTNNE